MSDKKKRVTVTLDPRVAEGLTSAAERAGSPSVSQYVQDAVDARMTREEWLARWRAATGDVDPQALAYARRALLGESVVPQSQAS
ncbi:hypothetical protein [Pseudonocardia spinosispora]|uniref:hypothetical protein n=1 Tax=Pseudonocardia spinosispora TaxID=103441 RepID=UPI000422C46F|nr:hypothetical protein [Pseudonocardia spinosispora]